MIEGTRNGLLGQDFAPSILSEGSIHCITLIEARALIRECLAFCMQKKLGLPVLTYGDVGAWSQDAASAGVIILSGDPRQIDSEQPKLFRELSFCEKHIPVIVFSDGESETQIVNRLRSGAKGYVPSDTPLEVVARAIKLVLVGGVFVPADILLRPVQSEPETVRRAPKFDFTTREHDVVKALLKGKSNKSIAYELLMSESSVKVHISNVMRKLQVSNRTEAVIKIAEMERIDSDSGDACFA
jgi:DNA-binding NarL/FixJ family response regulator